MSQEAAVAFLEKVETDPEFANRLASLREDPSALLERIHAEGYDVEPQEMREAFIERYGAELTQEQLDQIAAGADAGEIAGAVVGGVVGVGVLAGMAAMLAIV